MSATHQGMCDAQAKELELLLDLFRENPEDFWRSNKDCATDWNEAKFLQAINDCRLIPRADPNTLSHIHRLMRLIPLYEIAQANPDPYDKREVHKAVLERAGWSNPERARVQQWLVRSPYQEGAVLALQMRVEKQSQPRRHSTTVSVEDGRDHEYERRIGAGRRRRAV
jgi:hypothetical protein